MPRFIDISAYVMRRCGLNIFSLSNEEAGDVPFLPLPEKDKVRQGMVSQIFELDFAGTMRA